MLPFSLFLHAAPHLTSPLSFIVVKQPHRKKSLSPSLTR